MQKWSALLKGFGWVVVSLMAVAILYAVVTAVRYWDAIAV